MKNKTIIKYAAALGLGVLLFGVVFLKNGLYGINDYEQALRVISDCFAVSGSVLVLMGLLVVCANGGIFNIFGFGIKKALQMLKWQRGEKNDEKYCEYLRRKGKSKSRFIYLIVCGTLFLAASLLFLILYYNL